MSEQKDVVALILALLAVGVGVAALILALQKKDNFATSTNSLPEHELLDWYGFRTPHGNLNVNYDKLQKDFDHGCASIQGSSVLAALNRAQM